MCSVVNDMFKKMCHCISGFLEHDQSWCSLLHPDEFMIITDANPIVFFSVLKITTLMNSLNFYGLSGMCMGIGGTLWYFFILDHADQHGGIVYGRTGVAVIKESKNLFSCGGDGSDRCNKLFDLWGAVKIVVSDRRGDIKPVGVASMKSKIANR